jgi:antitoxin ChpS
MKLKIQKWGNGAAVRLPSKLLTQVGAKIGDSIEVDPEAIKVAKPKYKLSDLIAQCNKDAEPPVDMGSWNNKMPIGAEML